jgi:hypothetical protein
MDDAHEQGVGVDDVACRGARAVVSRRRAWRLAPGGGGGRGGGAAGHAALPSESKAGWGEAYTSLGVQLGQEEQVPANLER